MKLLIQRVSKAKVTAVEQGTVTGEINLGLFCLLGIKKTDTTKDADYIVEKLTKLRVMADSEDKMNLSITDVKGSLLIVSQFTLYGNTKGGNRPSFIDAALPDEAKTLYDYFLKKLKEKNLHVETGKFGAYMKIEVVLDGPVTIILESNNS